MKRAARVDDNQPEIVNALRQIGCSVQPLHAVGRGVPDLLVGVAGVNLLLEVKDGNKTPSEQKLTKTQEAWHAEWVGQKAIVRSVEEAINLVYGMQSISSLKKAVCPA